jgi:hypothetical protein
MDGWCDRKMTGGNGVLQIKAEYSRKGTTHKSEKVRDDWHRKGWIVRHTY